ncbi:putative membrane protein, predicted permease [Halapricum desulfuricans]|uniref:Putative membrane protein, predicted permease n=1 Tax=Halapricum desulfuricans TaxID=2841257 RepID=A0A897NNB6_9EURY|nr:hypothetical protein [Halapricum desulfuricans]QSG12339.1 putative membrane protein, predicted permease [Halapricum desulfuricans]
MEIARIDLLRGYRWVRHQDLWLAFTAVVGVMGAFFLVQTYSIATDVGTAITAGEGLPTWLVMVTSVVWLFLTVFLAGDAFGTNGDLDHDGQYLTIRPAADVVGGLLLSAAAKFSVYTVGLGLAGGAGLVVGTGSPLPLVGIAAAAVIIPVAATAVGYPIGLALKGVVRRSESLGRLATLLGVGIALAYVTLSVTGELVTLIVSLHPVLTSPPLTWFGYLAFVTTPGAGVPVAGVLALVGVAPLIVIGGTVLSVPVARYAWLADPARATDDGGPDLPTAPHSRLDAVLDVICRAPATRGIASTTLRRAVRSPFQFVFVAPPLLAGILFVESAVTTGTVPWYVPWFVVWYGAWAAGAVVPLNPLGNQGATLSTLLTSPSRGRHVVHGNVVAATLVAAPLTVAIALGAGYLAGSSPTVLAALALCSVGAVTGSAVLATGIGAVFPRFESLSLDGSRQAVPPSKRAYTLFSITLSTVVLAVVFAADETARVLGAALSSRWLPFGLDIGAGMLETLGWFVLGGAVITVPLTYRLAIVRLETYRLP